MPTKAHQAIDEFYKRIASDVKLDDVGGMTVAVIKGDEIISAAAFGWADKEKKIPATIDTIYRIGSITKSITAVALLELVEKGVLGLDDPVEIYLPEIRRLQGYSQYPPITFRQLASHTSGLIREPKLWNAAYGPISEWEKKVLASIQKTSFSFPPGKKFQYSNIGFGILGLAISRAAGKPFMELISELIFQPLGMRKSAFIITGELEEHLAKGYANIRNGRVNTEFPLLEHWGRGYKVPNGGVYTTVGDLTRFIGALTGSSDSHILNTQSRNEIQSVHTPGNKVNGYGLGFFIENSRNGMKTVSNSGIIAGYSVYCIFDPISKFGVILLRNYNTGNTNLSRVGKELLSAIVLAQIEQEAKL
ncbi:beta-lactamase family protein [Desulfobacterota bacterium AH_259_B03_O07]|nr:beta-lactamase family protein [Desulfobacterota bacterium AH_259_B03_O07]